MERLKLVASLRTVIVITSYSIHYTKLYDAFLQAWEERRSVNRKTLRSYLFTIVRNNYFKHYRKKNIKLNFINSIVEENEQESPEFLMEVKEFDMLVQSVIANIPDKTRAIFLMSRIDSMSYTEIADNLKISNKAVEKHISKALKIVKTKSYNFV